MKFLINYWCYDSTKEVQSCTLLGTHKTSIKSQPLSWRHLTTSSLTLSSPGDGGDHAVPQQHTVISELTAAFENTPEAALNLLAWIMILGKQCCFRAQVEIKAIIKTMDRKELWFLFHQGIKLPLNKLEYLWSITLIPSRNVRELRAVQFMRNFKSGSHNTWHTDIMLGILWNRITCTLTLA